VLTDIAFLLAAFACGTGFGYGVCLLRRAGWLSPAEAEAVIADAIAEAFGS
jgi:hypothetical protein